MKVKTSYLYPWSFCYEDGPKSDPFSANWASARENGAPVGTSDMLCYLFSSSCLPGDYSNGFYWS